MTWTLRDVAQAAREYRVTIFGRGRAGQRPPDGGCGFLAFCFGEDRGFSAEKPQQLTAASHNSGVGPQTSSEAAGKDVRRRDGVKDGRSFVAGMGAARRQLGHPGARFDAVSRTGRASALRRRLRLWSHPPALLLPFWLSVDEKPVTSEKEQLLLAAPFAGLVPALCQPWQVHSALNSPQNSRGQRPGVTSAVVELPSALALGQLMRCQLASSWIRVFDNLTRKSCFDLFSPDLFCCFPVLSHVFALPSQIPSVVPALVPLFATPPTRGHYPSPAQTSRNLPDGIASRPRTLRSAGERQEVALISASYQTICSLSNREANHVSAGSDAIHDLDLPSNRPSRSPIWFNSPLFLLLMLPCVVSPDLRPVFTLPAPALREGPLSSRGRSPARSRKRAPMERRFPGPSDASGGQKSMALLLEPQKRIFWSYSGAW